MSSSEAFAVYTNSLLLSKLRLKQNKDNKFENYHIVTLFEL